ncbi:type II toxin-antitoxin system HicA family toxin [Leptospira interrogans]|nr:type II toxin-antitoxin system HicA family toxin [Leptospira interrogans]UNE67162.1 type II toxin-antitoxin system HicA family toxin [Leptospira interrogans]
MIASEVSCRCSQSTSNQSPQIIGFEVIREREHISMSRENSDGTKTPLTIPNHSKIKGSTLRTICSQSGISRDDFLDAYEEV